MKLKSPAFNHLAAIPAEYTCESVDISPELYWEDVPANTKSFALLCEDPDAPKKTWVHWVVFNIPAHFKKLEKDISLVDDQQGINDFGKVSYGGPCPPQGHGVHHYNFTLYALDTALDLGPEATKESLLDAMKDHILDTATLIGTYERK